MFEEVPPKTLLLAIAIFSETFEFCAVIADCVVRTGFTLSNAAQFTTLEAGTGFTALLTFAYGFCTTLPLSIAIRLCTTGLSDLDELWLLAETVLGLLLMLLIENFRKQQP